MKKTLIAAVLLLGLALGAGQASADPGDGTGAPETTSGVTWESTSGVTWESSSTYTSLGVTWE